MQCVKMYKISKVEYLLVIMFNEETTKISSMVTLWFQLHRIIFEASVSTLTQLKRYSTVGKVLAS